MLNHLEAKYACQTRIDSSLKSRAVCYPPPGDPQGEGWEKRKPPETPKMDPHAPHGKTNSTTLPRSSKLEICKKRWGFQYIWSLGLRLVDPVEPLRDQVCLPNSHWFFIEKPCSLLPPPRGRGGKKGSRQRPPKWTHMRLMERQTAQNCHAVQN